MYPQHMLLLEVKYLYVLLKPQPCVFLPNLCDAEPTSCFGRHALEDEKEHKFYTLQILKRGTDKEINFEPS